MAITNKLEALLFSSPKPVALSALAKAIGTTSEALASAVVELRTRFGKDAGITLLEHDGKLQLVTHPDLSELVAAMFKQELEGELTRPQLETLTIVAYRGPITKPEMEQIRGVNCTLILRNLAMRGLVDEREDTQRLQPVYTVSADFLRHLGLSRLEELPDYAALHAQETIGELMQNV